MKKPADSQQKDSAGQFSKFEPILLPQQFFAD